MVRRLVGFYEYGNCLADLDQLVSLADEDDLVAIDEIIADHKEFDVYLRLPEAFAPNAETETVVTSNQGDKYPGSGREFRQNGLAWVTGLARVEFGAMIAGFTDQPRPFRNVTPQSHDYRSVMQLLAEGAAHHISALGQDPSFTGKGRIDPKDRSIYTSLKLSRRSSIAAAMLEPLLAPGASNYNREQAYQLSEAKSDLEDGAKLVNARISLFLASLVSTEDSSSTHTREFVQACGLQLRAERNEIEAGTATVTNYSQ